MLRKELPKMKRKVEASKDEPDAKKIKVDPAEEKQKEEMKKQNKRFVGILTDFGEVFLCHLRMFYYRDLMKKHMKKKELEALLEHNKQEIPVGEVENLSECFLSSGKADLEQGNPCLCPNIWMDAVHGHWPLANE